MRIFINNVDTYSGHALCAALKKTGDVSHRIFGTIKAPTDVELIAAENIDTVHDAPAVPTCVKRIFGRSRKQQLIKSLLSCSLLIYDLHNSDFEEIEFIVKTLRTAVLNDPLKFILISSVMVWARFTPPNKDPNYSHTNKHADEQHINSVTDYVGFTEDQYEMRIPPPKYEAWKMLETLVMSLSSKENLTTCVIGAGILYGNGEAPFYEYFKAAWLWQETHKILGNGDNIIPTVHIRDVASLVVELASSAVTTKRYFLAVDCSSDPSVFADEKGNNTQEEHSKTTQELIVKAIVSQMSIFPASQIPKLYDPQDVVFVENSDIMTLDLRLRPSEMMLRDSFPWHSKNGIVANIEKTVAQFCTYRNLRPVRVLVTGPPGSGKTFFSSQLAQQYNIAHINTTTLQYQIGMKSISEEEEIQNKNQTAQESVKNSKAASADRIISLIRQKLKSNVCRYRGFVLDGYPEDLETAEKLFSVDEPNVDTVVEDTENDAANEEPADNKSQKQQPTVEENIDYVKDMNWGVNKSFDGRISPDFVVMLKSTVEACKERLKAIDFNSVIADFNDEVGFQRRMASYQQLEETSYNNNVVFKEGGTDKRQPQLRKSLKVFFQSNKREVFSIDVDGRSNETVMGHIAIYLDKDGRPFNFMKTERQLALEAQLEHEQNEEAEARRREIELKKEHDIRQMEKEEEYNRDEQRLEKIRQHENAVIEAKSIPLRQYLMETVVPTLTEGLLEVAHKRPDDPIDFIAEYLFSHSVGVEKAENEADEDSSNEL